MGDLAGGGAGNRVGEAKLRFRKRGLVFQWDAVLPFRVIPRWDQPGECGGCDSRPQVGAQVCFWPMLSASRGFKLPGWAEVKDPMTHGYTVGDM
jgi:hypothetical protein